MSTKRVAVKGYSFGGYQAPRIGAFEKRYATPSPSVASTGALRWVDGNKSRLAVDPRTSSPRSSVPLRWWARGTTRTRSEWEEVSRSRASNKTNRLRIPGADARYDGSFRLRKRRSGTKRSVEATAPSRLYTRTRAAPEHCQVEHRQLGVDTWRTGLSHM